MKSNILICLCCLFAEFASAQVINKGYHGFVDGGYSVNTGNQYDIDWSEINTIHGYQFNPHLFVGGGIGLHFTNKYKWGGEVFGVPYRKRKENIELPIFADLRYTFLDKKVTPYADLRLGYNAAKDRGVYASLGIGCRVVLNNNYALYAVAALSAHKLKYDEIHAGYLYSYYEKIKKETTNISFRVGFEF